MIPSRTPTFLALLTLLLPLAASAADTGIAAREVKLLEAPRNDAKVVGVLPKDGSFEMLKREKFWALVSAGGVQGWVLPFYLSFGAAPSGGGATAGRALAEIVTLGAKPRDNSQVVATIGIRGISEEELKSAKFNATELAALEGLGVAAPVAAGFAQEGQLRPMAVEYMQAAAAGDDARARAQGDRQ